MAKIYSKNLFKNTKNIEPKDETINFILSYSKTYKVIEGKGQKYDLLLN